MYHIPSGPHSTSWEDYWEKIVWLVKVYLQSFHVAIVVQHYTTVPGLLLPIIFLEGYFIIFLSWPEQKSSWYEQDNCQPVYHILLPTNHWHKNSLSFWNPCPKGIFPSQIRLYFHQFPHSNQTQKFSWNCCVRNEDVANNGIKPFLRGKRHQVEFCEEYKA